MVGVKVMGQGLHFFDRSALEEQLKLSRVSEEDSAAFRPYFLRSTKTGSNQPKTAKDVDDSWTDGDTTDDGSDSDGSDYEDDGYGTATDLAPDADDPPIPRVDALTGDFLFNRNDENGKID